MSAGDSSAVPYPYAADPQGDLANRIQLVMQLRLNGVRDTRVLSAMEGVPREKFVGETFDHHAYEDTALPIACGQTISQPTVVAWMTAALDIDSRHTVLEIGTGSGYQTAILSALARRVYTIERHRDLLRGAEERFKELRLTNIVTRHGDGSRGWKEAAPFDRIIVTAAAAKVPPVLLDQLRNDGVMVIPVGEEAGSQVLLRVHKDAEGKVHTQHLMPVRFVPLIED